MDEIRELLLRRGFTEEDIDTKFRAYISHEKEWRINSITPEAVAKATSVEELRPLFSKDSVDNRWGNPWGASGKDFASFVQKDVKPFEIPAGILEPHIAFLASAVNEIGAFTTMSCDGWHDESFEQWGEHTMKLHMNERYSAMWLLLVMRQVFDECDNDGWDTWRFYDEDNARVFLITGDDADTVQSFAKPIGIARGEAKDRIGHSKSYEASLASRIYFHDVRAYLKNTARQLRAQDGTRLEMRAFFNPTYNKKGRHTGFKFVGFQMVADKKPN